MKLYDAHHPTKNGWVKKIGWVKNCTTNSGGTQNKSDTLFITPQKKGCE